MMVERRSFTTELLGHEKSEDMAQVALIRDTLRVGGWRLLAHNESMYGSQLIHYYAFAHPNSAWVYGMGVTELMALREVSFRINKYNLKDGPLPKMPYQIVVGDGIEPSLRLAFGTVGDAVTFRTWLEGISK